LKAISKELEGAYFNMDSPLVLDASAGVARMTLEAMQAAARLKILNFN
jgi:hypothetical protein